MLHEFLSENRERLVEDCRRKVAQRLAPKATAVELEHGIPIFLDQLIKTLRGQGMSLSAMGRSASLHGAELFQHEFTIDQVVHDYGDLCQAITELALEHKAPIEVEEFQVLNLSLDNAIAGAVTQYSEGRSSFIVDRDNRAETERLGYFAHELRNLMHTATLALTAIKVGNVGMFGATGAVLDRSMIGMNNLIDNCLSEVRARSGFKVHKQTFALADFITEAKVAATLQARASDCSFCVSPVDARITVHADRDMLMAAVGNLLQNAFKFSHRPGEVSLNAYATGDHVSIEVSDTCGGLPAGMSEHVTGSFEQSGKDRSGLGIGLSIVRRSVEANEGRLTMRDNRPLGCVFGIELASISD